MKWLFGVLALVAVAWGLKTELPAIKRYIKIERM
jgi:Family of unknown function (DUF6893)